VHRTLEIFRIVTSVYCSMEMSPLFHKRGKNEQERCIREKMEAQMNELDAEIDKLQAQAQQADADARLKVEKELDNLREKRKEAADKLDALREASEDAWEDIKGGLDAAWKSLKNATRSAGARFS